jgi:hypothetical protein
MNDDMKAQAVKTMKRAFVVAKDNLREFAKYTREEFDRMYGKNWQCIATSGDLYDLYSIRNREPKCAIRCRRGQSEIILFKARS